MASGSYRAAYNSTVEMLNKPFKDMRDTPEMTIVLAVKNARSALAMQNHHLTEVECDTMVTELLEAQRQAKTTGSGMFTEKSWQWPAKPEPRERIMNHHFVTDRSETDN